jgi:cell division septation protein DedD
LKPGESVELRASIQAPEKPGRYILEVTLVQEISAWFPEKKGANLVLPVRVAESAVSSSVAPADAPKEEKSVKAESQSGPWTVQLGSYAEQKVAANLAKRLRDKGYDAYVTATMVKGKELHRVRVGHLAQRADAEKLRDTLKAAEKLDRSVVARR